MATSSKRFIIIMILMNITLAFILAFANSTSDTIDTSQNFNQINDLENWTNKFNNDFKEDVPDTEGIQFQNAWGNVKSGQQNVFGILSQGVKNPMSEGEKCDSLGCNQTINNLINWGVGLVFVIINLLGVLEILFIIYGRKID